MFRQENTAVIGNKNFSINKIIYIFAARDYSIDIHKINTKKGMETVIELYRHMTRHDILQKTYVASVSKNPFSQSGFIPWKLVSSHIWIRK